MESSSPDPKILEDIQQRVLWLATRIVDAANHDYRAGVGIDAAVGPCGGPRGSRHESILTPVPAACNIRKQAFSQLASR